jgi:hypothetical protein
MARQTLFYCVQSMQPKLGVKTVYIDKSQALFENGVSTTGTGETVCFFYVSKRHDLTLPKTDKDKALRVASVGKEYAKMWLGPVCSSLFGALTGINPIMEVAHIGVEATAGRLEGGVGGVIAESQKGWEKDLRHKFRGTEQGADVAFDQDFIVGGCASFKWEGGEVQIRVKMCDSGFFNAERIGAKEVYTNRMRDVIRADEKNENGRADETFKVSCGGGHQSMTVLSDDFVHQPGQN